MLLVPYHGLHWHEYTALGLTPGLQGLQAPAAERRAQVVCWLEQFGVQVLVEG